MAEWLYTNGDVSAERQRTWLGRMETACETDCFNRAVDCTQEASEASHFMFDGPLELLVKDKRLSRF